MASKDVGTAASPFKAAFDVRTAFADIGAPNARVAARLGRQELAFGEQRLVGHVGWLNAARTFDAGRVTVRTRTSVNVDAFAASVVRILPDELDKSGNGNRFYGAYASSTALVPKATIEPYVFSGATDNVIRTEAAGDGHHAPVDGGGALGGHAAGQVRVRPGNRRADGSVGADDISAWASHLQTQVARLRTAVKLVTTEYNFATGDANATDGTRGTFDQLYPTPHDKYGLADQVGWRNVHHVRAGTDVARLKELPVSR